MANYSIELRTIVESPMFKLFDFDYDFYDEHFKCDFEEKFINHYYFDEIGFETVERFKYRLKSKLDLNMPYYRQLYETELAAEDINFLLNKDLKETFLRTLDTEGKLQEGSSSVVEGSNSTSRTGKTTTENNTDAKQSNIVDGVASASLEEGYLTNVASGSEHQTVDVQDGTTGSNTSKTTDSTTQGTTGKETEKTEMISQGNIGVTSSAELLEKWRSVLINLDKIIIEDCRDLFMGIY